MYVCIYIEIISLIIFFFIVLILLIYRHATICISYFVLPFFLFQILLIKRHMYDIYYIFLAIIKRSPLLLLLLLNPFRYSSLFIYFYFLQNLF